MPASAFGMVSRPFNLYPHMTALVNVTSGLRKVAGKSRAGPTRMGRAALERVGLADRSDHTPVRSSAATADASPPPLRLALEPSVMRFDTSRQARFVPTGRLGVGLHALFAR